MSADYKSLSRGISDDMSSDAIARRLDIASDLYDLAAFLSKARYGGESKAAGVLGSSPPEAKRVPPENSDELSMGKTGSRVDGIVRREG